MNDYNSVEYERANLNSSEAQLIVMLTRALSERLRGLGKLSVREEASVPEQNPGYPGKFRREREREILSRAFTSA